MSNPADVFASPVLPGLIIALTVFEGAAVGLYHRRTGRGVALSAMLPNLLAGDFLLLALGVALARGAWVWIGAALLASLVCHLIDLFRRWR